MFRKELLDHAWRHLAHAKTPTGPPEWYVDSPNTRCLRLCLTTTDPQQGIATLQALTGSFLAQLKRTQEEARAQPSPVEDLLADRQSELKARLDAAQAALEALAPSLPPEDPRHEHSELIAKWKNVRGRFSATHDELAEAIAEASRLHEAPTPTFGIVDSESRRTALLADSALQQDLGELNVNLVELKGFLLDVWQASAAPMDTLSQTLKALLESARSAPIPEIVASQRNFLDRLAAEVDGLVAATSSFHQAWNAEFAALRQLESADLDSEVLAIHGRIHKLLGDYLFQGNKHTDDIETIARQFDDAASQDARYYSLQTAIARQIAAFKSAFRKFGQISTGINAEDNFRLDAALRSAKGLNRRTGERIAVIDRELQASALAEALRKWTADISNIDQRVTRLRTEGDAMIKDLLALQDGLNLSAGLTDQFLRAAFEEESTSDRMRITQDDLEWTRQRIDELSAQRAAQMRLDVSLVECGVIDGPTNLWHKAGLGGFGALVTILTATFCQWWLVRRA